MGEGRGKRTARIAVDALMAIAFVLVMATALVAEAPHEYLGLALFALVVVHAVLNRRWFKALGRGRWTVVRVLQVASVLGIAACIVGQAASAVVLSKHAFAFLPAFPGSAFARSVHLMCSYWSFMFAFAHVGLQARGVIRRAGQGGQGGSARRVAVGIASLAVAAFSAFGVVSFVQLGLPAYLTGRVRFAAGNSDVLLAFVRWASVAVLVATVFRLLRMALEAVGRKGR